MADRIVVMNHGVIEQVGTPLEIYREPGDPLRRRLHRHDELPAGDGGRAGPGAARRDRIGLPGGLAGRRRGPPVTLAVRPEDLAGPRTPATRRPNTFARPGREHRVPRAPSCAPSSRSRLGGQRCCADFSINLVRRAEHRRSGRRLRSTLPAERLRRVRGRQAMARAATVAPALGAGAVRPKLGRDALLMRAPDGGDRALSGGHAGAAALRHAVEELPGTRRQLHRPRQLRPLLRDPGAVLLDRNSLHVALITTVITVLMAFVFAYALTRSCMPAKGLFKTVALVPILVPSLLPGIALVYLFGNQGMIKWADVRPRHLRADRHRDRRGVLHLAARADHRADRARRSPTPGSTRRPCRCARTKPKIFLTVTLPGVRYGLISAAFVVFTLAFTDFGAPKVIGGGLQRARHRHLQAGDRPAEFPDGRGRLRGPADPGGVRLHGRPAGAEAPGGAALGARGAAVAAAEPAASTADAGLSLAGERCSSSAMLGTANIAALVKF